MWKQLQLVVMLVGPVLSASLHRQVKEDIDKTWEIQPIKYVDVGTEALPEEGQNVQSTSLGQLENNLWLLVEYTEGISGEKLHGPEIIQRLDLAKNNPDLNNSNDSENVSSDEADTLNVSHTTTEARSNDERTDFQKDALVLAKYYVDMQILQQQMLSHNRFMNDLDRIWVIY